VLDDIAFRPLLEHPAGKGAPPFIVGGAAHVELNEGARLRRIFPRRGLLTGLEANDGVAHAQRLARLHGQVAGDAVTLVEEADHGDALRHRRALKGRRSAVDARTLHAHRP
jgi:hypothetical protein